MRIALYSPSSVPSDSEPCGAARTAGLIAAALQVAGHTVEAAARFLTDDRDDPARRARLDALGPRLAARLAARVARMPADARPELWLTYRPGDAAPDPLGPAVAGALGIPYAVVEPDIGALAGAGARAVAAADAVIALTAEAADAAAAVLGSRDRVARLRPFLDLRPFAPLAKMRPHYRQALATRLQVPADALWLLSVAMMRPGRKLESYRRLIESLSRVTEPGWCLLIVGDGPARPEVERMLRHLPRDRFRLAGALPPADVLKAYAGADLFVWPACREPHAMAILEAQAAGLPVVAGRGPGVDDVVRDGVSGRLTTADNPASFANGLTFLLRHANFRATYAKGARDTAMADHGLGRAADGLDEALRIAIAHHAGRAGAEERRR